MQPILTPGYVYVLAHPELPAWFKVGRTYRPPHARAQELSRTAWPSPLEVMHARFFWDSIAAEQQVHQGLVDQGRQRRREFFDASLPAIQAVIEGLPITPRPARPHHPSPTPSWDAPWQGRVGDADSWDKDIDRREEEWEAGAKEVVSSHPAQRDQGWRRWMRLSSQGWAEGSHRLADALYEAEPTFAGARRASWVYDAAGAQGLAGACLRAAWLRSWGPSGNLPAWSHALRNVWAHITGRDWETWPALVRETLLLEREACAQLSSSNQIPRVQAGQAFAGWDQLPPLPPMVFS